MKTTLLSLVLFLPIFLNAQITSEDFESYNAGVFDPQWDPNDWEAWFAAPQSHAYISTDQASSGNNSLYIRNDGSTVTDIVGLFGTLNTGIYQLTFMQYIPANFGAYYNLQHNYTSTVGDWAAEFYFGNAALGQARVRTNATNFPFAPIHDQWVENRFIFNFATEQAEFYYDGELIHTWIIPTNVDGTTPALNQINALNLYASCEGNPCVSQGYYDDILLEEIPIPDYDISLINVQRPTGYTIVPNGHVQPFSFGAEVFNIGTQTVNNVEVTAHVYDGTNTLVHTETVGTVGSLASGATSNFSSTSTYTPSASDIYQIEYIASMDETDENPANNGMAGAIDLTISDSLYARDDGNYDNWVGITGSTSNIGQNFEFLTDASIIVIASSYAVGAMGDTIIGHIYSAAGNGAPDILIASSEPYVIQAPGGGVGNEVHFELEFVLPVALSAGNYVFCVEQPGLTNIGLSTSQEVFTPGTTWGSINGGAWAGLEGSNIFTALNIRPILDLTISTEEPAFVQKFELSPNPTNGKAIVEITLDTQKDLTIDVLNMHGQVVRSIRDQNVVDSRQYPLDLTNLVSGVYFVKLTIDGKTTSRKLVLSK